MRVPVRLLETRIGKVLTDSRELRKGDLFVAFRGKRSDGHDFIDEALRRGAVACVVERRWWRKQAPSMHAAPLIVVKDTIRAYGDIARMYRDAHPIPLVGVTGSNGKTATKELIAAVLGRTSTVLYTEGNYNNQIGLPATLLRLDKTHDVVVAEMGTDRPGDIAYLCSIAKPTHGVITNIGFAHISRLRSREGIAEEKGALFATLPDGGIAILDADEELLLERVPSHLRRITFGSAESADVRITGVELDADAKACVRMEFPGVRRRAVTVSMQAIGRHAAWNAAAAAAVGLAFHRSPLEIKRALESVPSPSMRMQVERAGAVTIINDTYNANPDSMLAAIDVMRRLHVRGRRIVVLGDMLDLGRHVREEHERIGVAIIDTGITHVFTFGVHSRAISIAAREGVQFSKHYTDKGELMSGLVRLLADGDAVLVKGSRKTRMEEVVDYLTRTFTSGEVRE